TLIKSQVDPQMPQSTSQTRRAFIRSFPIADCQLPIVFAPAYAIGNRHLAIDNGLYCGGMLSLIIANAAPCGSLRIAKRPIPGISSAGFITVAPSPVACCSLASQSSTAKYTSQCGGIGPISGVISYIPPAPRSPLLNSVYCIGPKFCVFLVQPNRFE